MSFEQSTKTFVYSRHVTCTSYLSFLVNSLTAVPHDHFFPPKKVGVLDWSAGAVQFRAITGTIALCS